MIKFTLVTKYTTEMIDVTAEVQKKIQQSNFTTGYCVVFVPHTTAAVTLNENADPAVRRDILIELNKIVPQREYFTHVEGNSAAHIKASMIGSAISIIVEEGKLMLGTWQGIYFCEFDGPREREVWLKVIKD